MAAPKFSIVLPVFDTPEQFLEQCLKSIINQDYRDWELCLVDDASTNTAVRKILARFAKKYEQIKLKIREDNGGIATASNDAIEMATGEFVVLVDHDDLLEPDALTVIADYIARYEDVDFLYTDEYILHSDGRLVELRKPHWSPERLRTQNYLGHLSVIRRDLLSNVGNFSPAFAGAQDYDLMFRVTEAARRIVHIPIALYYWRNFDESFSRHGDTRATTFDSGRRAVEAHCQRVGIDAVVERTERESVFRIRRPCTDTSLVSIVIPTRGSSEYVWGIRRTLVVDCVRSVLEKSSYQHLEIVVVADTSMPRGVVDELSSIVGDRLTVVWYDRAFNFSDKVNVGVSYSTGKYIMLLNDDTELISSDWCEETIALLQDESVGAVGGLLLYDDGTIQHAGHQYINGRAVNYGWKIVVSDTDHVGKATYQREVVGVTAAAMMVRRAVYEEVGGFSVLFPGNYNDVDFCRKIWGTGRRVILNPYVRWYHFESKSRDPELQDFEVNLINKRWWREVRDDVYDRPLADYGNYPQKVRWRRAPKLKLRT